MNLPYNPSHIAPKALPQPNSSMHKLKKSALPWLKPPTYLTNGFWGNWTSQSVLITNFSQSSSRISPQYPNSCRRWCFPYSITTLQWCTERIPHSDPLSRAPNQPSLPETAHVFHMHFDHKDPTSASRRTLTDITLHSYYARPQHCAKTWNF